MVTITEGNLSFNFNFDAIKFDDTQYYKKHFQGIWKGITAVDILAVDKKTGYLIEIKDYTHPDTKRLKITELIPVVVDKVLFTLSAMIPMKQNAFYKKEKNITAKFCNTDTIQIVLHIEKSPPKRKLEQSTYKLEDIQMKMKRRLKPIDAHPKVVSKNNLKGLPWEVT